MTALKQALEEIRLNNAAAEAVISGDSRTGAGREAARRQARYRIPELQQKFLGLFRKVGFPVFVRGAGVESYLAVAAEQTEVVAVVWRVATGDIRAAVQLNMTKDKEFSPHTFAAFVRTARQLGAELGLTSIRSPDYKGPVVCPKPGDVDTLVDGYIIEQLGSDFAAAVIEAAAVKAAAGLECSNPVIPVIITNFPSKHTGSAGGQMFSGKYLETEVPGDADEKFVTKTFKDIKSALKA